MVLKLYSSTFPAGGGVIVALVLAEKQIPFEHVLVNMESKQHKTPEFLAMHPFGQVPVIDDGGFVVYESRAICRYLAEKYADKGTPLLPKGLKERTLIDQAASVEAFNFYPAVIKVVRETFVKARNGQPVDQAVVDEGIADLSTKLDVYEVILGKHKFLAGDEFTLADILHYAYAPLLADSGIDIMTSTARPNVARWDFSSLPQVDLACSYMARIGFIGEISDWSALVVEPSLHLSSREKQIPFEHVIVDMAGKEHKTPAFLAMHPFGQIPVIDDDGFIVYESRAICRYLAEKYADKGTPLLPKGLKERTLVEQAASVEFANFYPSVIKVAREAVFKPRHGGTKDQAVLDEGLVELGAKLDVYEVILGKQKFLAGNEFTLADVFHYAYAPLLAEGGVDIMTSKERPNVARWWNELVSRPTWMKLKAEGIKGTEK
ncbi:Glutathione S-transferase [Mycena venus]|uniref:glutathione transferase n=1 Tax=Mycena venus TaxID=2733690 RepID=A0A8H6YN26_9AGAR|nr:Glutathione S-transferase [Mycena venus]